MPNYPDKMDIDSNSEPEWMKDMKEREARMGGMMAGHPEKLVNPVLEPEVKRTKVLYQHLSITGARAAFAADMEKTAKKQRIAQAAEQELVRLSCTQFLIRIAQTN
jgi:hypothetical protein